MSTINSGMIDTPLTEALSRFLDVNVARHKLIASNLANIDTPGYRHVVRRPQHAAQGQNQLGSSRLLGTCPGMRAGLPPSGWQDQVW